ncbi:hypothetical protein ACFWM1_07520 [Nocardia sp. NPDC058379]|uniref:hypothetical protein n=1 Tax=unclassified Nocardia TaxID=2637762 RepID=UPI0036634406
MTAPVSLFDHAMRLHRESPEAPLPQEGYPFPDDPWHGFGAAPSHSGHRRAEGMALAALLDAHFGDPARSPVDLAADCHRVHVPPYRNEHVVAAALRVDAERVRATGRWLVRRGTDRCAVRIGLALLGTVPDDTDIPLLRTIGLLSDAFSRLVVDALARCRDGTAALLWLGPRVDEWGREIVVEKLCEHRGSTVRDWLLRNSCRGSYLDGYVAGKVAIAADLATAITADDPDLDLVHHTTVLLSAMTYCAGAGLTLDEYPAAARVLDAHSRQVARLEPSTDRYRHVGTLADYVRRAEPTGWARMSERYLDLLNRPDWAAYAP